MPDFHFVSQFLARRAVQHLLGEVAGREPARMSSSRPAAVTAASGRRHANADRFRLTGGRFDAKSRMAAPVWPGHFSILAITPEFFQIHRCGGKSRWKISILIFGPVCLVRYTYTPDQIDSLKHR
jgi:hypothetical protein